MSALHFLGRTDTKEEALILNQLQEHAVLQTLLQGRDPRLYQQLYGLKNVRPRPAEPPGSSWCCRSSTGEKRSGNW